MDPVAWVSFLGAVAATLAAARAARRRRVGAAVALLVLVSALLHGNLAWHEGLGRWDERYHAVVARNLIDHPLVPTLIERPLYDADRSDWLESHVWLHKPPLATWLMAGSMALFGENEPALRLPSVLLASLAVALTFLLARRFLDETAALLAAGAHAWFGRLALLSAGMRATDHVDAIFIVFIELGVLLAVLASDRLGARRRAAWWLTAATGAVTGLAYLTKDAPSLLVLAVFGVCVWQRCDGGWRRLAAPAVAFAVAAALAAPWRLYTALGFPDADAGLGALALSRMTRVVESHAGPWSFHLANLSAHYGPLTWIPIVGFLAVALARRRDWLPLVAWLALTYLAFSLAATKMDSYVLIAAPVIFCALGWFAAACGGALLDPSNPARRRALYGAVLLLVAASYTVGAVLKVHDPTDRIARRPLWAQELQYLGEQVAHLPGGPWVVFGAPAQIEAMFYARATFSKSPPRPKHLEQARARGLAAAVYGWPDDPLVQWARESEGVRFIPCDPRALAARQLLQRIRAEKLEDALIVNAPEAAVVAPYLHRLEHLDVLGAVQPEHRDVRRAVERGRRIAVIERPGESVPGALASLPGAVVLRAE